MKEYTFSAFVIDKSLFEKPQPHRVWWRRFLGQTESKPVGTKRLHYTFKAPPEIVDEKWFQDVLKASMMKGADGFQLEIGTPSTPYIRASSGKLPIESTTNLMRYSGSNFPIT